MTISITSLSPIKNETSVPVAADIQLTLTSDTVDIDITTLKFTINDVEVQASAYYGITNKIIDVGFFSRRKIKYNTRRYGEPDFSYGKRDIFPSSFQYGYRYVCLVQIQDVDGLLFEERFSFTVEEGIFYNENPTESFYYTQTQAVSNYIPEWAKARYDKYSNFQQFINAPGRFLQEIEDSLFSQTSSYYVQTADLNELSTLYKIELGGDFIFQTIVLDDGTTLQIPPDISTIKEITRYNPPAEFRNDIKSFYKNKLPTRLDEERVKITDLIIVPKTKATDLKLLVNKKLERDGYIAIKTEDGLQFTQIKNNDFKFVSCRIKGKSRENKKQTEDLTIIDNDTYYSSKLWKSIESIQFINNPKDSNLHYIVDHARPPEAFIADAFSHVTFDDVDKSVFWKKKDTIYGSTLQSWVLLETNPEDIISSLGQKDLVAEFELLDIDNSTNLNLIDIESDRFSNYLYGIDNNYLYIFDKREDYSNIVKKMPEDNSIADFVLNLDTDELGREDSTKIITVNAIQKTVGKSIAQYRLSIERPDSITEYLLPDGSTTINRLESEIVGERDNPQLITQFFFYELDIVGDYLIKLETVYVNGETSIDTKIARVGKKTALVKYHLERIFNEVSISRFFIDFDQQLKVLDVDNYLHTIRFVKDNMLVDYSNSIVYFNENYEEAEIE